MTSYYGVDAVQAARSGLTEYKADAGIRSLGAGTMLRYKWSETLSNHAFVEYQRLSDVALDSPTDHAAGLGQPDNVGLGTSISFTVGN